MNALKQIKESLEVKINQLEETYDTKRQNHIQDMETTKRKIKCLKEKFCTMEKRASEIEQNIHEHQLLREKINCEITKACENVQAEQEK